MYGIDVDEDGVLERRSWRWLQRRIAGLINAAPLIAPDGTLVPSTRLGWELNPPTSRTGG